MAVDWLILIPMNPAFVPAENAQESDLHQFAAFFPSAECQREVTDDIVFVDQGANFTDVQCPQCGTVLDMQWWQECMDSAFAKAFTDLVVCLPCCHIQASLNELRYNFPAAFARFRLQARNPASDLDQTQITALESILQSKLSKIWAHY